MFLNVAVVVSFSVFQLKIDYFPLPFLFVFVGEGVGKSKMLLSSFSQNSFPRIILNYLIVFNWTSFRNIKISMLKVKTYSLYHNYFHFKFFLLRKITSYPVALTLELWIFSDISLSFTWNMKWLPSFVCFIPFIPLKSISFLGSIDHYLSSRYLIDSYLFCLNKSSIWSLVFRLILLGILKPGGMRWFIQLAI